MTFNGSSIIDLVTHQQHGDELGRTNCRAVGSTLCQSWNEPKSAARTLSVRRKDMLALSINEAIERLAKSVEAGKPTALAEIYAEIFPEKTAAVSPSAAYLAQHIRRSLEAEVIVALWNVVFPADRNVWYDEEKDKIHSNEEAVGYAEAD